MNKVNIWCPLPPAKSGIATYNYEIIDDLAKRFSVNVISPSCSILLPAGVTHLTPEQCENQFDSNNDVNLYQLGNNADHEFVWHQANKVPGVLVLHDMTLHHLVEDITLSRGQLRAYSDIMAENYGSAGYTLASLRQIGIFTDSQRFSLTLNNAICSKSLCVIVHSEYVAKRISSYSRKVFVTKHHFSPKVVDAEKISKSEARSKLGLPDDIPVILSLGFITPPKKIDRVLAALESLDKQGCKFIYILVGEKNAGYDVVADIKSRGLQESVLLTDYVDEDDFFLFIRSADLLVNLRFPTAGESSGTLARSLALGLCSIIYNYGPMSEYPDNVVVKVPVEMGDPMVLSNVIKQLISSPGLRESIGLSAKNASREKYSVSNSVDVYQSAIKFAHKQLTIERSGHIDWIKSSQEPV